MKTKAPKMLEADAGLKNLTLLAFKNTSAELLIKGLDFPKVCLPSDKILDSQIAIAEMLKSKNIICFGQKPQIKNKICLELIAKKNGRILTTNFDLTQFEKNLAQNDITFSESKNPGTSYCNQVYGNALEFIQASHLDCRFLFIHVPFEKNICDISGWQKRLSSVLKSF